MLGVFSDKRGDDLEDLTVVDWEVLEGAVDVAVVFGGDLDDLGEDLSLFSQDSLKTEDIVDFLRLAHGKYEVEHLDQLCLFLQLLPRLYQIVISCNEHLHVKLAAVA